MSQYTDKAIDILVNRNPYGAYHKQNFQTFNSSNAPVNSDILLDMPKGYKIILEEGVFDSLYVMQELTKEDKKEHAFLMFGEIDEQQKQVVFNKVAMHQSEERVSGFQGISKNIDKFAEEMKRTGKRNGIVCYGHTHPPLNDYYKNYSLADLGAYIQLNQENDYFRKREIELCSCLLADGNYNFLFYDNKFQNFFRFHDVYARDNNRGLRKLPCYNKDEVDR